jgi:hypothetical protein
VFGRLQFCCNCRRSSLIARARQFLGPIGGLSGGFLLELGPGIPEVHCQVEYQLVRPGIRVEHEVALALELEAITHRRVGQ